LGSESIRSFQGYDLGSMSQNTAQEAISYDKLSFKHWLVMYFLKYVFWTAALNVKCII